MSKFIKQKKEQFSSIQLGYKKNQIFLLNVFRPKSIYHIVDQATIKFWISLGPCRKQAAGAYTVKLGDKERFDKKQIGVKKPFPVTNC